MHVRLRANATTTPHTRAYIQKSTASNAALARELGIHPSTVARWRGREEVQDRSHVLHRLATTMSDWEEALTVELRTSLGLPLDDIVEAMRRCVNPKLSRSGIHRCLQRYGVSAKPAPEKRRVLAFETDSPAGWFPPMPLGAPNHILSCAPHFWFLGIKSCVARKPLTPSFATPQWRNIVQEKDVMRLGPSAGARSN